MNTLQKYAAEFLRLSRFAPYMVADEEETGQQVPTRPEDGYSYAPNIPNN